ncbi:DUF4350 domain-containing protein [Chitinophaga japonensis]|uniref:Uncharacterized protein DUF4350 n=1 Tax=Chitinophaga japonensis TaxID=104662 RepID=A0A562T5B0_CHIJA|nr:DUF4350 domain-containing protein [Chitinophaga japonensis]TWI88180.1 uncharacterized protein DUF4350 [Chitinophaga japonensis]
MKSKIFIIITGLVVLCFVLLLVAGNQSRNSAEAKDLTRQSFSHKDKHPGGCYVAFTCLQHLYSGESLKVMTKPFTRSYEKNDYLKRGDGNLYILVADKLYATTQDIENMLRFAADGNQLFLAVNQPDSLLKERLGIAVDSAYTSLSIPSSVQHFVNPFLAPDTAFHREGIYGGRFFTRLDTLNTTILGTNGITGHHGPQPNFIRISYGKGDVFVSLNPSSFTNYFLMHGRNISTLEKQVAYTYNTPSGVYWDEYYKYLKGPQTDFSEWQVLMRYPALRWALWLFLALLLLYVLFESKRRQRIIPDRPVLANNSLEFVETLGQLYYQQGNNRNLAQKMILHWTEYVRTRFYLSTQHLNPAFADTLARKSGMPYAAVRNIVDSIHHIQLSEHVTDDFLQQFYKNIHQFYLNTK